MCWSKNLLRQPIKKKLLKKEVFETALIFLYTGIYCIFRILSHARRFALYNEYILCYTYTKKRICNIIQLFAQILSRFYNLQLFSEQVKSTLITVLYRQNEMNCEKCVTEIKTKKGDYVL